MPSREPVSGVLLDGESIRVDTYAPRTMAVLLAAHEKDSDR